VTHGRDSRARRRYCTAMSASNVDELLAAIRRLPLDERLRLLERAARDAAEDTPKPGAAAVGPKPSLLGLMADEPDIVDRMCSTVYEARARARMRIVDE
jgi:hypothetical protein